MALYDEYLKESGNTATKPTGGLFNTYLAEKNPAPNPIVKSVKDYAQASADTVPTVINAIKHPIDTVMHAPDPFMKPAIEGEVKAGEGLYQIVKEPGAANKVAGIAKFISGIAQTAFSPITGLFTIAQNVPGLKQVADVINVPFTATGFAGSYATGKIIDWIPDSIVSKESKDILKASLQELGALAGQVALGGKIMDKVGDFAKKGEVITPEHATKIVEDAKLETADHPAMQTSQATPKPPVFEQYKQENQKLLEAPKAEVVSVEPAINDFGQELQPLIKKIDKYQTIEKFKKAYDPIKATYEDIGDTKVVVIDAFPKKEVQGVGITKATLLDKLSESYDKGYKTIEPSYGMMTEQGRGFMEKLVKDGYIEPTDWRGSIERYQITDKIKDYIKQNRLEEIYNKVKGFTQKIPKVAADVNASIVEKGFKALDDTELAKYDTITKKKTIEDVTNLLSTNLEQAKRMATGKEPVSGDIHPQVLFNAVEQHAIKNGDYQTLIELAKSPIATERALAAQTLGASGFNNVAESPVKIIEQVRKTREKAIERRTGKKLPKAVKDITDEINKEIKKNISSRPKWEEFINQITCGY